ncbi:MAG: anti-sigma factor family protein [Actinomycetota bacterium]
MNCGQAERWMDAALDLGAGTGAAAGVSQARRAAFDAHLAACPTCRRQWEALQTAEAVLRVPRPVAVPEGMLAEFRNRLEAETAAARTAPRVSRSKWAWLWPAGSLAAAGAAAGP